MKEMSEKEQLVAKVTDRLRGLCSRREYCASDMLRKAVQALDGDVASARDVVDSLIKDRFVDDFRYASAFARDKSSIQGWGDAKIRYMLSAKGISRDVISRALDETDGDKARRKLEKLMDNKFRSLKDDPQCRLKLIRFGLGRGYGYEEVEAVINGLI